MQGCGGTLVLAVLSLLEAGLYTVMLARVWHQRTCACE